MTQKIEMEEANKVSGRSVCVYQNATTSWFYNIPFSDEWIKTIVLYIQCAFVRNRYQTDFAYLKGCTWCFTKDHRNIFKPWLPQKRKKSFSPRKIPVSETKRLLNNCAARVNLQKDWHDGSNFFPRDVWTWGCIQCLVAVGRQFEVSCIATFRYLCCPRQA